jgi:hypothetical protein
MIMKNLWIGFLFFSVVSYGQEFRSLHLLPDSDLIKTVIGKRVTYVYQQYTFEGAGKILKIRENKRLICADEGEDDLKITIPHIFLSDSSTDYPVLMTDLTSEVLYGFNIYVLNGLESIRIGFFPVAAIAPDTDLNPEKLTPIGIADKLVLQTNGTVMRISFSADKVLLRPGTSKEEIVNGDQVKFLYNGKKLKEVEAF